MWASAEGSPSISTEGPSTSPLGRLDVGSSESVLGELNTPCESCSRSRSLGLLRLHGVSSTRALRVGTEAHLRTGVTASLSKFTVVLTVPGDRTHSSP